jgi:hypothetical protein
MGFLEKKKTIDQLSKLDTS